MISRQKAFFSNIHIETMDGIIGLDYLLKDVYGLTLRQVIMATTNSEKTRLFAFLDQTFGSTINIAYRSENLQEVQEFIESMPIILSDCFNLRTWTWFDKQTATKLQGYN